MSRKSARRLLQFAFLAFAAGELSYAAAEVLILRTDGPSVRRQFRIGARVPDNHVFNLRAGDRITVLARGGTRTFRGPGAFSVVAPPEGYRTENGVRVRIQTGVVRTETRVEGVDPTDIWHYDSRESGNLCVRAGAQPTLWRPADHSATRLTIRTLTGDAQSVDWPVGQTSIAWPAAMPVVNGATFTLNWNSESRPARVRTIVLGDAESDNLDTLADTFIRNQCTSQLDTFIAIRTDPTATPSDGERGRSDR
ncbi:MAG TPA: hypothetical protein VGC46_05490 [Allosphingosinicella sp.]